MDRDWLRCVKETGCPADAAAVRRRRRCHGPWLPTGEGYAGAGEPPACQVIERRRCERLAMVAEHAGSSRPALARVRSCRLAR